MTDHDLPPEAVAAAERAAPQRRHGFSNSAPHSPAVYRDEIRTMLEAAAPAILAAAAARLKAEIADELTVICTETVLEAVRAEREHIISLASEMRAAIPADHPKGAQASFADYLRVTSADLPEATDG